MRDSQRGRVYTAEKSTLTWQRSAHTRRMTDLVQVWAYLERIERDRWFRRHYGTWRLRVDDGRGRRRGAAYSNTICRTGTIKLPRFARHPMYILHEVAHCVDTSGDAAHGRAYCRHYLALVRHFLGCDAERDLRAAFKANRVRHRPKRVLSDSQRAALVDRLAAMRQKLAAGPIV